MLVKNLAKGIVNLCTSQESGDGMLDLRKQIVSGLVVSLLDIESTADATDNSATDNVSKGLRKVNNFVVGKNFIVAHATFVSQIVFD